MAASLKRTIINPILAVSGGLSIISGTLMFFKIKSMVIVPTHEISSIVFVLACVAHLALNWKPLLHSFRGRKTSMAVVGILSVFVVAMLYSTTLPSTHRGKSGKRSHAAQEIVVEERFS